MEETGYKQCGEQKDRLCDANVVSNSGQEWPLW